MRYAATIFAIVAAAPCAAQVRAPLGGGGPPPAAAQGTECVAGNTSPACGELAQRAAGLGLAAPRAGRASATGAASPAPASPLAPAQAMTDAQRAAMGDQYGGRPVPPDILKILADPRIEPITAYVVWQAARKPLEEWTLRQLQDITATLPTLAEAGIPIGQIQALYAFLGLDPSDIFNPQLGEDWQRGSTRFDPNSSAAVAEISSADCQTDPGQMTVGTYRSCISAGQ